VLPTREDTDGVRRAPFFLEGSVHPISVLEFTKKTKWMGGALDRVVTYIGAADLTADSIPYLEECVESLECVHVSIEEQR